MRILLFYDNWIRDYRGLLLLKEILKRRGHKVWIYPLWKNPISVIQEVNPHTVVMGQISEKTTSDIGLYIKENGINLIISTPESVDNPDRFQNFFKMNFRQWNTSYIDMQILVNHDMNQFVMNHPEIGDKDKYKYIGFPRFDLSVFPEICQNETQKIQEKYSLSRFNKKYLYVSSFIYDDAGGQVTPENVNDVDIQANRHREATQKEHHEKILGKLIDDLQEGNDVLLIKRHPWDKSLHFKDVFDSHRVILLDNHDYIAPVLQVSDIVLHAESTVAVEAWIQQKKTVSLLPNFDGDRSQLKNHMQYEPIVGSYDELVAVLDDYPWQTMASSLKNYELSTDGKATLRFAKLIESINPKNNRTNFNNVKRPTPLEKAQAQSKYADTLRRLPSDSYEYHLHYMEQFRRRVDHLYERPIQQHVIGHLDEIKRRSANFLNDLQSGGNSISHTIETATDLITIGRYSNAIERLSAAFDQKMDIAHLHYLMGRAVRKQGDPDRAVKHYECAIQRDPDTVLYQCELAEMVLEKLQDANKASAICHHILERQPSHVETLWLLARIGMMLNNNQQVVTFAATILEIEPCHTEAKKIVQTMGHQGNALEKEQNYSTLIADPDLGNIKELGAQSKRGLWRIRYDGLELFTNDLASFYIATKDIFIKKIYDFRTNKKAPVIIDGGGHIGLFTIYVKKKYPSASVTVFEPDPVSVALLRKNLLINGIDDVTVIEAGLYDQAGKVGFQSDGADGSSIQSTVCDQQISVEPLSPYIKGPVDCLKLNIEGAELPVIKDIESTLSLIQQIFIEYHGFPEIGQQLHEILSILDASGFRYLIHDFDHQTNPATKPPFAFDERSRFFLLIYAKQYQLTKKIAAFPLLGAEKEPIKRSIRVGSEDQALSIMQFYEDEYLHENRRFISGEVAVVGEKDKSTVLSSVTTNTFRTAYFSSQTDDGLINKERRIEDEKYDCIIISDLPASKPHCLKLLRWSEKALRTGGSLLLMSAGGCGTRRDNYLQLTDRALGRLVKEVFGSVHVETTSFGNIATAKALLDSQSSMALSAGTLRHKDADYQILVGARMTKGHANNIAPNRPKRLLIYTLWRSGAQWISEMVSDALDIPWVYSSGNDAFVDIKNAIDNQSIAVRHLEHEPQRVLRWADLHDFNVLFIWRDIRDVIASKVNQLKAQAGDRSELTEIQNMQRNDIIDWEIDRHKMIYSQTLSQWVNVRHPRVLALQYESMVDDPLKSMETILSFTGAGTDQTRITAIIEKHDLKYRSDKNADLGDTPTYGPKSVVGAWKRRFNIEGQRRIATFYDQYSPLIEDTQYASVEPVSRLFGFDRGTPIDRHFIERFLNDHKGRIRGRVLEIGDSSYTSQFGNGVTHSDVLNAVAGQGVTIVGDLAEGAGLTADFYDCIILTQTIQCIYFAQEALATAIRALRPGGSLLLTTSGISQISRYDMDRWGEFWRLSDQSLVRMVKDADPDCEVHVTAHGNAEVAKAFLDGLALHEVPKEALAIHDAGYPVVLTATIVKPPSINIKTALPKAPFATLPSPGPCVLIYHRVAEDPVDAQMLSVSPKNFEQHLIHLHKHTEVVPLEQIVDAVTVGENSDNKVAVTFDDGYADNLIHALPLIEAYQIPVTVFITSGAVNAQTEFWWDALEHLFFEGPLPKALDISLNGKPMRVPTQSPQQRLAAYETLCANMRSASMQRIGNMMLKLYENTKRVPPSCSAHRQVSEEELKALDRSPWVEIGAHTVNHPRLSSLSTEDQMREICASKRQLEAIIRKPVRLFSYPFGSSDDFTEASVKITRECGFTCGIANIQGHLKSPVDRYRVPRRLVRNWTGDEFRQWLVKGKNVQDFEENMMNDRNRRLLKRLMQLASYTEERPDKYYE